MGETAAGSSRKLFETTASTIQAGDASILLNQQTGSNNNNNNNNNNLMETTPKLKSNMTKSQSSELLAFKALHQQQQQQQQQQQRASSNLPVNNQVELKCLNDFILPNNFIESKKSKATTNGGASTVLNGHDVYRSRFSSAEALDRHRSTSEEPTHLRYPTAENFHQSRKLHTENDLLPTGENTFEQQQLKILSNIALNSNGSSSGVVIKRHLAGGNGSGSSTANNMLDKLTSASSNRITSSSNGNVNGNNVGEFYSSSAHDFYSKPLSRKVAVSNSAGNFEFQGRIYSRNMFYI